MQTNSWEEKKNFVKAENICISVYGQKFRNDEVPVAKETILADSHGTQSIMESLTTLHILVLDAR